ncbi:CLUMA_CG004254, isoform A [Clunio marinus]|uniref:CLUMA_CG004254, isoform A n=1 Tax=Clunio marinus TaxID=568069 RepID=A0A1J1HVM2_9DIPT|nr:CLUMA_CG004254, isoform A [Clunio marinus]
MPPKIIHLKSQDGVVVSTTYECAQLSHTIKDMLEMIGTDSNEDEPLEIPLMNVHSAQLHKIVEWIEHWKDIKHPTNEEIKNMPCKDIDPWNKNFLKVKIEELYELIAASNYLNIPGLLWLTTREVAYMIKETKEKMENPLSVILVKSDSKGDRLLFRYPYTADKAVDDSNKQKKKQNPYSIALIEDTHQNIENPPSGIGNMSDEVLSSLFACKQNLANQKFELKINDIRFVSHPALMENKNSFILINIVFALQAQCSYSIVKCYYELSKRLGLGLLYEERRVNYLTKEMKTMLKIHDDTIYDHKSEKIFDTIVQTSSLAQCLKTLYHDLCTTGLINVVLNESVTLCFCLPQKAWNFRFSERRTKNGQQFIDPEIIDRCIDSLKPYHGFLLLVDPSELLDCVPPSGAKILLQLIESYNPLKSLQSMASDSDLSIDQVNQMVGHLVYWAKATIIYPLCETNVYVISPDAPIHVNSPLVERFATKFPGMSLIEVISDFSLPTSIGHLTTPLQHPARQGRLAQMVLWMLQHHLLMQLHTYVQFMPSYERSTNDNSGLSLADFASSPKQSITHSPEKSPKSDPLDVPNGISGHQKLNSNQRVFQMIGVDDESINSVDDDDKIRELLNAFDECDREAILKVPASANFEDLNLMVRLWQSGYFKGEHHLEEIMFYENLRRSQLLQLLDKFRDVLILYETEDPASCLLRHEKAEIIRISEPIKSTWAKEKNLNLTELLSDGPYKEKYRKQMIQWSDEKRAIDYGIFCCEASKKISKPIVIVSDIRRKTDIKWFRETFKDKIKLIRIKCDDEIRCKRGWKFEAGVDDIQSECDLDNWDDTAQQNLSSSREKGKYYSTKFEPPKKVTKEKRLSAGIQKFLEQKKREEEQKAEEARRKKLELVARRDPKEQRKIDKTLKVIKSSKKFYSGDKTLDENTAITLENQQPDEDDYGYTSTVSDQFHKKLMEKYSQQPETKKFSSGSIKNKPLSKDEIQNTKDRVKNAFSSKDEEIHIKQGPQHRTSKLKSDTSSYSSSLEKKIPEKPKFKPKPAPIVDFQQLLKLAEQKQHEEITIEVPQKKEPERLLTHKEKLELEETAARKARSKQNKMVKQGAIPRINESTRQDKNNNENLLNKKAVQTKAITNPMYNQKEKQKPSPIVSKAAIPNNKPSSISSSSSNSKLKDALQKPYNGSSPSQKDLNVSKNRTALPASVAKTKEAVRKNSPLASKPSSSQVKQIEKAQAIPSSSKMTDKPRDFPPKDLMRSREFPPRDLVRGREFPPRDLMRGRDFPPREMKRPKQLQISNKRRIEDEDSEYDSELDDFIDDSDVNIDYSAEIKNIFGYDKSRYRDEDFDDSQMESDYRTVMREEYISKKAGILEDLEDMKMEAEEKKRKDMKMKKKRKL